MRLLNDLFMFLYISVDFLCFYVFFSFFIVAVNSRLLNGSVTADVRDWRCGLANGVNTCIG